MTPPTPIRYSGDGGVDPPMNPHERMKQIVDTQVLPLCEEILDPTQAYKISDKLKVASMLFSRVYPELKSVELKNTRPLNINIISVQDKARLALEAAAVEDPKIHGLPPELEIDTDAETQAWAEAEEFFDE